MNPFLRIFAVGSLLAASFVPGLAAGFEGKVSLAMTGGKGKTEVLDYSIKDSAVRMDINAEGHAMATIMDLQKLEMYMLMPEQQMYMVMPIKDKIEKAVDQVAEKDPNMQKTGRTDTILGYKCDEYVLKERDTTTEVWVTEGLGSFMGLGNGGGRGGPMGGMFGGKSKSSAAGWEQKFKGKPFFPLRVISRDGKSREIYKMEVTKIEPGSLPASQFAPPAGWQKFQMPNMGDMLKGMGQ